MTTFLPNVTFDFGTLDLNPRWCICPSILPAHTRKTHSNHCTSFVSASNNSSTPKTLSSTCKHLLFASGSQTVLRPESHKHTSVGTHSMPPGNKGGPYATTLGAVGAAAMVAVAGITLALAQRRRR